MASALTLWRRLVGSSGPSAPTAWLKGTDWLDWGAPYNIIAGESHHAATLKRLTGPVRESGYCRPVLVRLRREPRNEYDQNAIAAYVAGRVVGHLRRDLAAVLAPVMDDSDLKAVAVCGVLRGGWPDAPNVGCHLWIDRMIGVDSTLFGSLVDGWRAPWPPDPDELR